MLRGARNDILEFLKANVFLSANPKKGNDADKKMNAGGYHSSARRMLRNG
jgi:hypothetical protein